MSLEFQRHTLVQCYVLKPDAQYILQLFMMTWRAEINFKDFAETRRHLFDDLNVFDGAICFCGLINIQTFADVPLVINFKRENKLQWYKTSVIVEFGGSVRIFFKQFTLTHFLYWYATCL